MARADHPPPGDQRRAPPAQAGRRDRSRQPRAPNKGSDVDRDERRWPLEPLGKPPPPRSRAPPIRVIMRTGARLPASRGSRLTLSPAGSRIRVGDVSCEGERRSYASLRNPVELDRRWHQGRSRDGHSLERVKSEFEKRGTTLEVYWTVGPYDGVGIMDAPDDESATATLLWLGSAGNVRTTTMRAFDANEMARVLERVGT